jgi:hypothetical protein
VTVQIKCEVAFQAACSGSRLDVVCELLDLVGGHEVGVHAEAFQRACISGHVGVVRELLALGGDREIGVVASGCLDPNRPLAYPRDDRIVLLIVSMCPGLQSDLVWQLPCHWLSHALQAGMEAWMVLCLVWCHW